MDDCSANELPSSGSGEPFPARPAFDAEVYSLLTEFVNLVKQMRRELMSHASVSKELQNMVFKADALQKLPVPEKMMVALVGATGDGVSQPEHSCELWNYH